MANRKNQLLRIKPNEQNESEATELLLASIRAKMGIIDIYKVNEKDWQMNAEQSQMYDLRTKQFMFTCHSPIRISTEQEPITR